MAAGIVVLKKIEEEYKVLCLFKENKKGIRKYDLTKGKVDKGETIFKAAIRETYEESGVKNISFKWGKNCLNKDTITMYVAETGDIPKISKNPESGIFEHDGFEWNSFEVAYILLPDFLKPFVIWAENKVKRSNNVKIQGS
jgi:8-oxo-dGTP pyrophosphatase MutT (NUDIX family)